MWTSVVTLSLSQIGDRDMMQINDAVKVERRGKVNLILVNNPPVNALGAIVREGLLDGLKAAMADRETQSIVLACEGRTFIAGADISEFGQAPRGPDLHTIFAVMEGSDKPIIAALHGTALGGGLETALSCHYRVSTASARFGLPEVTLGIIPGAGGTQRVPRLVGVEKAVEWITTGAMISAGEALKHGLIDEIVEGDLIGGALQFANSIAVSGRPHILVRNRDEKILVFRGKNDWFEETRKQAAANSRGMVAPSHAVTAVEAAVNLPFDEGIRRERELAVELVNSAQSKAMRYVFFAERESGKIPGLSPDVKPASVKKVAIIGSGTMGSGIGMAFANAGIAVTLIDQNQEALDRGTTSMRKLWDASAAKGRYTQEEVERRLGLIQTRLEFSAVADADVIIEAVWEQMKLKQEIFKEIDKHAKPGAVLGTNTSTLDINEIAAVTSRPEAVIGLHFFSPANVMKLLEVVRGDKTADAVIATAMATGKQIKKVPVLVGVCDGFVGNRILAAREQQTEKLLIEGALPAQVDKVLTDFGFPMGGFAMQDMSAGIELGWRMRQATGEKNFISDTLAERGRFGLKVGKGFYRYEQGSRKPLPDPEVEEIIEEASRRAGVKRRQISDEEIRERALYIMINEGCKIVDEGIALRASDIDVIYVYGYGWPTYRGGPMYYADTVGLARIRDRLREFEKSVAPEFRPAALLEKLAAEGKSITEYKTR
jgi:3-hydroxyacyl-CoA dehydrogenase